MSLRLSAYAYSLDGSGKTRYIGKVNHFQSLNTPPLKPRLLVQADGAVELAHCTCMAGLGEACSHIAAVLFYLEVVVKQRGRKACTDMSNSWRPAYAKNVACCPIADIDFSSATAKKKRLDSGVSKGAGKPRRNVTKPTEQEWGQFFEQLHAAGTQSSILSLTREYA
ncbi:unnamed protein product, partial [Ixodes hexagonus]